MRAAPHLHFHVMTSPSALGPDAIPYALDSFELAGRGTDAEFDAAQLVAGLHPIPNLDLHASGLHVSIEPGESVAVVDDDVVAIVWIGPVEPCVT